MDIARAHSRRELVSRQDRTFLLAVSVLHCCTVKRTHARLGYSKMARQDYGVGRVFRCQSTAEVLVRRHPRLQALLIELYV